LKQTLADAAEPVIGVAATIFVNFNENTRQVFCKFEMPAIDSNFSDRFVLREHNAART